MASEFRTLRAARWLGTTCACAIGIFNADLAFAACTYTGSTVVCDTSAPNPSYPIAGSDILLLQGAQVKFYDDPYAGAALPDTFDTVTVYANGNLETRDTSLVSNFFPGAASINVGGGSTVQHGGTITNTGARGIGMEIAGNTLLTVGSTGFVYASGQNGTALQVTGTGSTIRVDGVVGNASDGTAINMVQTDLIGRTTFGSADIAVGASGVVRATSESAIVLSSGSSLDVAGIVRAEGAGSAVEYRGAEGGSARITVQAGGTLQSRYQSAIVGTTGSLDLTVAGTVAVTDSLTTIQLGAANDAVTLVTGSSVGGLIDAGGGTDTLTLTGIGQGTVGATANFETANFASGVWTLAAPFQAANGVIISAGATAIGSADKFASPVTANGTLQIDQPSDATFTGSIAGTGRVTKSGTGTLTLGAQSFTGATSVQGGTLALTSNLAGGTYDVGSGATITSGLAATISTSATNVAITNSGTVANSRSDSRAINFGGSNNTRTIAIVNNAGATITSSDDAVRVNYNPAGGSIRVDNYGTIQTTAGGQALDFNAAVSGAATVVINNYQSGQLLSVGQDAIRPGQGAVVTNAGLIRSDGPANNSYDGIDWQQSSGKVVNTASGTISGLRHGITSDVAVDVTNAGTIVGRNGSGVGSDGTGTIVNTGTITGQWDGVAINGDGDGVDIDFAGTVVNSGTIQGLSAAGVDSGGRANSAEGVAMGGGSITNNAAATIFGAGTGILINHDSNAASMADAATTIVNAGTIRGGDGRAITLVGNFADTITNSGTITGGKLGAIDMGAGDDTLALTTTSVITGAVDGGAGNDVVMLGGTGNGTFARAVNFEALQVNAGTWTLINPQSYTTTTIAPNASLTGDSTSLAGSIADAGSLQFDQATDARFAGSITGKGQLVKSGAGTLTLGNQSFAGSALISQGRLVLAGDVPSAFTVGRGGTLAGQGVIRALTVQSGGLVAPGSASSVGTITITGNYVQNAGATYAAKLANGTSDLILVGGTATLNSGAILSVTANGAGLGQYTLLTATGGLTGQYGTVTADITSAYSLTYNANSVVLNIGRTNQALLALAGGRNALAVASAVVQLPRSNQLYTSLALASDAAVGGALRQLTGDIYAAVPGAMIHGADLATDAVLKRTGSGTGLQLWGQFLGSSGDLSGSADIANVEQRSYGGLIGLEDAAGDVTVGLAGGYVHTRLRNGTAEARAKLPQVLLYARTALGQVKAQAGVGYVRASNRVDRTVSFGTFNDADGARYKADVIHGYGELGVPIKLGDGTVTPFAGGRFYRIKSNGFTEAGGPAALHIDGSTHWSGMSELGTRLSTPAVGGISAYGRVSWQHRFGAYDDPLAASFVAGGSQFQVRGAQLSRDAAALGLGLGWAGSSGVAITVGYDGRIGNRDHDNTGRIALSVPL